VTASAGNAAAFVRTDTTTKGHWKSVYGSEGYSVIQDTAAYPPYAKVTFGPWVPQTWANTTSDPRALERVSSGQIAASLYQFNTATIDLRLTDGLTHTVAFYFLDWEPLNRSFTLNVLDGDTGATLDSRHVSNFQNGTYYVWNVSGHVTMQFVQTNNSDVISGIFFGGGPYVGPPPVAVNGPFGWASEPTRYATCDSGCRVRMNLIPDRVAYYVIERNNGGQVTTSPVMVAVQQ